MSTAPLADPVLEADRILAAAEQQGVVVRLIGGLFSRLPRSKMSA